MKRVNPRGAATFGLIAIVASGTAAAEPDFSGVWQAYASVPGLGPGGAAALTEEGARLVDGFFAELGDNYVEPGAYCVPPGMGYSIGRWEGETLVIETRLLGEYLMRQWPRTENTQIVERVYRANRDERNVVRNGFPPESESNDLLVFEMTVTDNTLYKGPQRITMYYHRIAEDQFLEYDCIAGVWEAALRGETH
jgi:hypothetical protein